MAGRMSIRRYLKPIDGLPDTKGSLSTTIPSATIASANREDRHLVEFGGWTPRICTAYRHGNLSHSKPSPSSMLTARSLNARTIYGACIIIYCVKLFSSNFFIRNIFTRTFFHENLLDEH